MNIQTGGKVSGVYGIKVLRNAGTDKEHLEDFGESPNMLLDGFFERFASGNLSTVSWYMFVGTGTTPVDATQTQLTSQVGSYDSLTIFENDNVKVGNDYIASSTGDAEWAIGAIVGNISEVGVRLGGRIGSTLDSRALIVDSQGNPTTITVTAEDKLVVSYTLKYIIPTQPQNSVVDFLGTSTTCTLQSTGVLDKTKWGLKAIFCDLSSRAGYSDDQSLIINPEDSFINKYSENADISYSVSALTGRRVTYFGGTIYLLEGNGVKNFALMSNSNKTFLVLNFEPPIQKDETKTLTLNFDFTLTRA
jgi:hypothetical protein